MPQAAGQAVHVDTRLKPHLPAGGGGHTAAVHLQRHWTKLLLVEFCLVFLFLNAEHAVDLKYF